MFFLPLHFSTLVEKDLHDSFVDLESLHLKIRLEYDLRTFKLPELKIPALRPFKSTVGPKDKQVTKKLTIYVDWEKSGIKLIRETMNWDNWGGKKRIPTI